jgi:adenylate kinase family enzyme
MILGSPGVGKSDIANGIADDFNLQLIDLRLSQCDQTDLNSSFA